MVHRPHNFRALSKPKQLNKGDHKHYLPFIPVLLLVVGTFLLSLAQPIKQHGSVLAYSTDVGQSSLLQATNTQRTNNGKAELQINSTLSAAAQAKADDMTDRNYWSHTTPDGQQPWIFVEKAGYAYEKAGENLAYGFRNSNDTVSGWMNSASHRANLLDDGYTEIGFGFANSSNYNDSGEETVVVAIYGKPLVLGAATQVNQFVSEPNSQPIARLVSLSDGAAPMWSVFTVGILTGCALMLLLVKHAAGLRHLVRDSERFVLHHPLVDGILVGLVLVGSFLSQTTGFIR